MTENKQPVFQQSETVFIQRSQINFAPYNPKNHSKEAIIQQKKNFKRVGFLGGVVWNKTTGNLVSGHKRIMSMDSLYKYDGTPETDYQVKVEQVEFDLKTEMEQNIYMDAASANTQQDSELLKIIIPDIDYINAGLTEQDLSIIGIDIQIGEGIEDVSQELNQLSADQKKEKIKASKKAIRNDIDDKFEEGDPLLVLSFDSFKNKSAFMRRFEFDVYQKFIKGEVLSGMIERVD